MILWIPCITYIRTFQKFLLAMDEMSFDLDPPDGYFWAEREKLNQPWGPLLLNYVPPLKTKEIT